MYYITIFFVVKRNAKILLIAQFLFLSFLKNWRFIIIFFIIEDGNHSGETFRLPTPYRKFRAEGTSRRHSLPDYVSYLFSVLEIMEDSIPPSCRLLRKGGQKLSVLDNLKNSPIWKGRFPRLGKRPFSLPKLLIWSPGDALSYTWAARPQWWTPGR